MGNGRNRWGAVHFIKVGWHRVGCGRSVAMLELKTTHELTEVTCKNCLDRIERLKRFEIYAGHEIPIVQIEFWSNLERAQRWSLARRFHETSGKHNWHWYNFSDDQRALLLGEICLDRKWAWQLGIKSRPFDDLGADYRRQLFKRQAAIIKRVMNGQQNVETLNYVLEIQQQIVELWQ